jgi:porphobilinogen synthase
MPFPQTRLRRLRTSSAVRNLVQENRVNVEQLVLPLFVGGGSGLATPLDSLPGVRRWSIDMLPKAVEEATALGIRSFLLFADSEESDRSVSRAWQPDGRLQEAIRTVRAAAEECCIFADMCLCTHTPDAHCGLVHDGKVLNDESFDALRRIAVSLAAAGADFVAPSGMLDGRVGEIRAALDTHGHTDVGILSYAIKFASALYEPFRDTMGSAPRQGDRRTYQLSPANDREALREAELDLLEGADMLIVKPAWGYLDIVAKLRARTDVPIAGYNVSGEYALIKAAAAKGWVQERPTVIEMATSIFRAGADILITYHALDLAEWARTGALDF